MIVGFYIIDDGVVVFEEGRLIECVGVGVEFGNEFFWNIGFVVDVCCFVGNNGCVGDEFFVFVDENVFGSIIVYGRCVINGFFCIFFE